jgi:DUF438 domain-containing protein
VTEEWTKLLMRDHETTEKVFEAGQRALARPEGPEKEMVTELLRYFAEYVDGCHNLKEENHLFPLIESRGVPRQGGPLAVMLGEHDESRKLLAQLRTLAAAFVEGRGGLDPLRRAYGAYAELLKQHFWKENDILYPMAQRVMSASDGATIVAGIESTEAELGPGTRARYYELAERLMSWGEIKDLAFGLDHATIGAILNTLPVELSFVDADDTVRYFSHENHDKIFPRTRGAIGTKVQNCHPQKSVHLVNRILSDFKAGRREVAEFWIEMGPRKVHIRYWPVRSPSGAYLGCLETVQDIAPIQMIQGQRRLLDDAPAEQGAGRNA